MLNVNEIVKATNGKLLNGDESFEIKNYRIDSRLIDSGDFYIPLAGENVDGHKFILDTVKKGCSGFLISDMSYIDINEIIQLNNEIIIIKVDNTKDALINLGIFNRRKNLNIDVIAVTGSVGKTSTREMIASVISEEKNVMVTQKNMNSHIGMPLMDLMLENQDMAILEAGIDFVGEMDILNKLLVPDVAVVTNIGTSHIGKFGSQDVIFREKTNISKGLKGKKILLLNGDDKYLKNYKNENVNVMYYRMSDAENIKIYDDKIEYDTIIYGKKEHIIINAIGNHNILNSLVAIKIAQIYNLSIDSIKKGVLKYKNFERRMERIELNNITLIDDTYNASPSSTESGLVSVNKMEGKRKIAVLADILELGDYSKELHSKLGEVFKDLDFKIIIAYGNDMKYLIESAKKYVEQVYYCNDIEEATNKLKEIIKENDIIYFKGSNGMKVNKIVESVKKDFMN
jgi:UDP-N-acetylmuramoyl-tripeptide--D-alanyl-D-alanine ligase